MQKFVASPEFKEDMKGIGEAATFVAEHLSEIGLALKTIIEIGFAKTAVDMAAKLYEFGKAAIEARASVLSL